MDFLKKIVDFLSGIFGATGESSLYVLMLVIKKLIGLAGCSADCEEMWQIGVDVLPAYRRQGIASALTSRLAKEILKREKVPFYCSAWSNIRSVRNAVKSGFIPAWVELSVKPAEFVDKLI